MSIPSEPKSVSNRLLSALPYEEYRRVVDRGQEVVLELTQVLHEARQPIRNVYFMLDGLASIVTPMQDGTSIEVLIVSREGMVGLPALESADQMVPTRAFMQMPGRAIQIDAAIVRDEFSRGGTLQRLLFRYIQFALVQVSQSAACNRLHDLEERLGRWLLMVQNRIEANEFALTHEFLAQILGTRRSSVTLAAGTLQRAGLIEYRRGRIQIVNREGLEDVACECYANIKESWDLLLK